MPHHVRQQVHHNVNQNTTTDNIERPSESVKDPVVCTELEEGGDRRDNHKGSVPDHAKPVRRMPDEYNEAA